LNQETALSFQKEATLSDHRQIFSDNFPVSFQLYSAFIEKNKESKRLTIFINKEKNVHLITWKEFEKLSLGEEHRWSILYSLSSPSVSIDEKEALIQVAAYCPSGAPNYCTLYFLKKNNHWQIAGTYCVYNQ